MDDADKALDVLQSADPDIGTGESAGEDDAPATTDDDDVSLGAPESQADSGITWEQLAEKKGFKSPDDLARAYSELESHNKTVEMDRADLLKARESGKTAEDVVPEIPADKKEAVRVLDDYVARHIKPIKERMEINELFAKHDDAAKYAKAMAAHVKSFPQSTWEQAYRFVKFDDLEREGKKKGITEAYETQTRKERAGTVKPTAKGAPKSLVGLNLMDRSISLSEIERLLPHG